MATRIRSNTLTRLRLARRSAFSLVELLIVCGVVALLFGILMPALINARRQARAVVCASNLRQVATANLLYLNDHEQRFCPGAPRFMTHNLRRWHGTRNHPSEPFRPDGGPLMPYLGADGRIRACPSFRVRALEGELGRHFERNSGGYGYNLAFVGRTLERRPGGGYRLRTDLVGARADHVRRPAETVMFADAALVSGEPIEYSFLEPRLFPLLGMRPDPSIHFRHGNRVANVAWTDGHIDRRSLRFSWRSGLYPGDPADFDVGWFGEEDDNTFFDLE